MAADAINPTSSPTEAGTAPRGTSGRRELSTRRSLLLTIMTLGLIVTGVGATGILAVFTDTADTGQNYAQSASLPSAADLKLALYDPASLECYNDLVAGDLDAFTDGLESGLIEQPGLVPGDVKGGTPVCIRNAGSAPLTVEASALDLVDTELDCTNDEPAVDPVAPDDTNCGLTGELSTHLSVSFQWFDCETGEVPPGSPVEGSLPAMTSGPLILGDPISSGEVRCYFVGIHYDPPSAEAAAQAQTDMATWTFRFTGTA
jgi:hypothetical protein